MPRGDMYYLQPRKVTAKIPKIQKFYEKIQMRNGKWKTRRFSLIRLPFVHHAKGFGLCRFANEEKIRGFPFANGPNGVN
jgi:hypothetical protein